MAPGRWHIKEKGSRGNTVGRGRGFPWNLWSELSGHGTDSASGWEGWASATDTWGYWGRTVGDVQTGGIVWKGGSSDVSGRERGVQGWSNMEGMTCI